MMTGANCINCITGLNRVLLLYFYCDSKLYVYLKSYSQFAQI